MKVRKQTHTHTQNIYFIVKTKTFALLIYKKVTMNFNCNKEWN